MVKIMWKFTEVGVVLLLIFIMSFESARADVLYESATLGPTGQVSSGTGVGRANPFSPVIRSYYGVLFEVQENQVWQVTAIGGHFCRFSGNQGSLFGAIIELAGEGILPPDPPLVPSDAVVSTTFVPDYPSTDYRTTLSVELQEGYYALVFGSDDLGASGGGMAVMNNIGQAKLVDDYPIYAYIDQGWNYDYSIHPDPRRVVIEGTIIPEPASAVLMIVGSTILSLGRRNDFGLGG